MPEYVKESECTGPHNLRPHHGTEFRLTTLQFQLLYPLRRGCVGSRPVPDTLVTNKEVPAHTEKQ